MKTFITIISLTLFVTGCSSIKTALDKKFGDKGLDERKVEKELKTRLESYDLKGAKEYYATQKARKLPWCARNSYKCRSTTKRTPKFIKTITTDGFQCVEGLIKCKEAKYREDVKECMVAIDKKCRGNYSNWSLNFRRQYERYEKLAPRKIATLQYREKPSDPLGKYRNQCRKGMKWGYYKTVEPFKTEPIVLRTQKQKFFAQNFRTKADCEASFFNANKDYTRRARPSGCHQRFIGKTVKATIYMAKMMYSYSVDDPITGSYTSPRKAEYMSFDSLQLCKDAQSHGTIKNITTEGGAYSQSQELAIQISPINSNKDNRFITGCKKRSKIICNSNGEEIY